VSQTLDNARTEAARLEALVAYGILDTPPEQAFDDLIELAAGICYTPVAAVVFVDADRAWLKAKRGVEVSEFPRDATLASEALKHGDVFAVRDALADERYHESAVVSRGFRFFAGMPLVSPERHALGAVCVLDTRPRELSSTQKDALRAIARQVMNQLELRRVSRAESLARHKFSWLVEQLPGGVYIEDLGASSGSYFSPQVERITGYSAEEWASGDEFFGRVLHPDDRDRVLSAFARAHEMREPIQIEYRVIAKDGRVVWIQDDADVARDEHGEPVYIQGFMADATVRKQNELKLREIEDRQLERERAQNEHLRSVDRMKDEFVALVSHELRTPLTSIRGYLELVMDEAEHLPAETQDYLEIVGRNADRLLHLVGDLLLVAQAEAGKLTFDWVAVELVPLVEQCVRAAQPAAEAAGVELRVSSEASEPIVGDPARIAQLLDNLISNAIKFTPVGGHVDVLVDACAGSAVIEVRDTGFGVAPEDQEQLFERFFRTQSATNKAIAGTGLGLSIAKAIVEAHEGSISVQSAEGQGTTFRVELPAGTLVSDRSTSRDSGVVVNLGA
jgi:PAS domain S-box-containing protein